MAELEFRDQDEELYGSGKEGSEGSRIGVQLGLYARALYDGA